MQTNRSSARVGGLALGIVFAAAACTEPAPLSPPSFAASSPLPGIDNSNIPIPVNVSATLTAEECGNNPGPRITFQGVAAVSGFGVELTFSSNLKSTHDYTADRVVDVTFQSAGDAIVIPKQPSHGGVGGNPFIWVQFVDAAGNPTSDEIFLGRCVQGTRFGLSSVQSIRASGYGAFDVTNCGNSPGPLVNVTAGLTFDGMGLRIIFRNNVRGPHEASVSEALSVIPAGLSRTFPRQSLQGGVGGNPWILAGFTSGGTAVGEPALLGRCEQLS